METDRTETRAIDASWAPIPRERFFAEWDDLPPLTVVAALPGWGRTEWMRACRERIVARDDAPATVWLTRRADVEALLASPPAPDAVCFLDDVLLTHDDPLWTAVADAATPGCRFVVSSIDSPEAGLGARVVDERALRFTAEEIDALLLANRVTVGTDTRDDLDVNLQGCPALVRRQLERLQVRRGDRVWASLDFTFERALLDHLLHRDVAPESTLLRVLRHGTGFRRFSAALVASDELTAADAAAQFDRLDALPLGSFDVCDETGERDWVWSAAAWRALDDLQPPRQRAGALAAALARSRAAGRVTVQLFYLLALGRIEDAELLVFDQYRRFLLFTDAATQEALLGDAPAVSGSPSLMLLGCELRLRTRGAAPQNKVDAAQCYDLFAPPPLASAVDRFRLHCRRAMAAAYAGRRATALHHLAKLADQLDPDEPSRLRYAASGDRAVAARIAADLFLAFWAAVQTDRHDLAMTLVGAMREFGNPDDVVTQIDRLTAITEEDFAGLRSLAPDGARPEGLEFSHAAALVLIEEGDDRDAIERTHPLAARVRPAPTRSAADALLLLSRALVAPEQLDRTLVDATVALSAGFWDDGAPSSFIAFSAVVAHVASGRMPDARAIVADVADPDWFVLTARAIIALAELKTDAALSHLERAARRTSLPRLEAVTGVLTAAALARAGMLDAAAARLDALWRSHPAPRLVRFGLRFLDADQFTALARAAGAAVTDVRASVAASAGDRRPSGLTAPPALSPVEREILVLLRRGAANPEIAAARGVSHNTVRTQIRLLYRKLGATDRTEAVAIAERLRLLDAGA